MARLWRLFGKGVLGITAMSIVASTVYLPEARLPVVFWLLSVALMWRSSPRSDR